MNEHQPNATALAAAAAAPMPPDHCKLILLMHVSQKTADDAGGGAGRVVHGEML
jgi:hypothetical protein